MQVRFIEREGEKSWSVVGLEGLIKEICRPILSCGLVLGLTIVAVVAVIYLLVPAPAQEKAFSGLGIAVAAICVYVGIWAKRRVWGRVKQWWKKRREQGAGRAADRGKSQ